MTNEERATKIKEIMVEQDMSKARLKRRTTLHINTINNLLGAKCTASTQTLIEVGEALDVNPAKLL